MEYIIIDGGSTDQSVDIIKKYSKYLKYWISEPDMGQSHAINKGIKLCTGEVFNWLNSDDYYEPDALEKVLDQYQEFENIDIVCGRERVFRDRSTIRIKNGSTVCDKLEHTILTAHIDQPPTFWKTSVVRSLGGINESLHYLMDVELWLKYLIVFGQSSIVKIDDVLTNFREHAESKTVSLNQHFVKERSLLRSHLIHACNPPDLIAYLINDQVFNDSNVSVELPQVPLNVAQTINAALCEENFGEMMRLGQLKEARSLFMYHLKYGNRKYTWNHFKILLKVLFVN